MESLKLSYYFRQLNSLKINALLSYSLFKYLLTSILIVTNLRKYLMRKNNL